jgi:hypothetical protein
MGIRSHFMETSARHEGLKKQKKTRWGVKKQGGRSKKQAGGSKKQGGGSKRQGARK